MPIEIITLTRNQTGPVYYLCLA